MFKKQNVAIIGAGTAGLASAIVIARLGHEIALFEQAAVVENRCIASPGYQDKWQRLSQAPRPVHSVKYALMTFVANILRFNNINFKSTSNQY